MGELDGVWEVKRVSGALPPLTGVRKRIMGRRGHTLFLDGPEGETVKRERVEAELQKLSA